MNKWCTARLALLAAVLMLALAPARIWAQVASATLPGTVSDPSAAAVAGATVTAAQPATGFSRIAINDANGQYTFDQLAPGPNPDFGPFFGTIFAAGDPRRMQFALRYDF